MDDKLFDELLAHPGAEHHPFSATAVSIMNGSIEHGAQFEELLLHPPAANLQSPSAMYY